MGRTPRASRVRPGRQRAPGVGRSRAGWSVWHVSQKRRVGSRAEDGGRLVSSGHGWRTHMAEVLGHGELGHQMCAAWAAGRRAAPGVRRGSGRLMPEAISASAAGPRGRRPGGGVSERGRAREISAACTTPRAQQRPAGKPETPEKNQRAAHSPRAPSGPVRSERRLCAADTHSAHNAAPGPAS